MEIYDDSPESLTTLCLRQIIATPINLDKVTLPAELGHLLANTFRDLKRNELDLTTHECEQFFNLFKYPFITLSKINFSDLPITDSFLKKFLVEYQGHLKEIDVSNCPRLTHKCLDLINTYFVDTTHALATNNDSESPTSPPPSPCTSPLPLPSKSSFKSLILGNTLEELVISRNKAWNKTKRGQLRNGGVKLFDDNLKLNKLVLYNLQLDIDLGDEFVTNIRLAEYLTPAISQTLKYLDLSCSLIGHGSAMTQLDSLEVLILYDCRMTYTNVIPTLCSLKNLRVLDLSRQARETDEEIGESSTDSQTIKDQEFLKLLVIKLQRLTRLDISGTDLIQGKDVNIPAFESRVDRPFEFLGLFRTSNSGAYRLSVPALSIAGEADESQLLTACQAYMNRPEQLSKVLKELNDYYKSMVPSEPVNDINRVADIILPIITRHLNNEQLMVSATLALWWINKLSATSKNINYKVRRIIISRFLDVMHRHKKNKQILFNGVYPLILSPSIIYEYSRVASITLYMVKNKDARTQSWGIAVLNTLACQVGSEQKEYIGSLMAIEIMLDVINDKIAEGCCDEALETAWSTLWNITDETPSNCKKFLDVGGLGVFEKCMNIFGNNTEVLRNIMGLLGNVAECPELRPYFMKDNYIDRFNLLLDSNIDGIECSYNACGILAHLVSEGDMFWKRHYVSVSRQGILSRIKNAILSWPINSRRNINYRSFTPIAKLLSINVDPEAQLWAVWALANLTRIIPSKYCPMLERDGGLKQLQILSNLESTQKDVKNFIDLCIYQFNRFTSELTLSGLEQCDSVDMDVVVNFRLDTDNLNDSSSVLSFLGD